MEGDLVNEELELFREICLDENDDEDEFVSIFGKAPPIPPRQPVNFYDKHLDFQQYIEEKCENKIKILDRQTFHQIDRPIFIAFNHFREKCYYHTKWLDRIYQLALKYGNEIEFIAADQSDIDVIYPHRNPIGFFCYLIRPEDESISAYVIDRKKQIFQHFDAYQTVENLSELCDKLLSGELYISQPIPEAVDSTNLVKTCVHLNYNELVAESGKDVLLIVSLGDYQPHQEYEPDYELLAREFQQLDIVWLDGDKNYVPFKYNIGGYPTIIFIPHTNKEEFVEFREGPRDTENLRKFISENIGPQGSQRRQEYIEKRKYKPFKLPEDRVISYEHLEEYVNENCGKSFQLLRRENSFPPARRCVIIYFMNFQKNGVTYYLKSLQKLYQVAESRYGCGFDYYIADLQDIDVMYPKWYKKYLHLDIDLNTSEPQVFAIDRGNRSYKVKEFPTASSLFYYSYNLTYNRIFHSQQRRICNASNGIISCVADNLKMFIQKSKRHMFFTVYWGTYRESCKILKTLEELADDLKLQPDLSIVKIDAKLNTIPLEYTYHQYPVHFFIPRQNKKEETLRFISTTQSKEELMEFLKDNIKWN